MSPRELSAWREASRIANLLAPERSDPLAYWLATEMIFEAIRIFGGFRASKYDKDMLP